MAARRRPVQGGQLVWQPCYPCAALAWSQPRPIVRICSPIRPNAGCSAVYVQKAGVVAAFGCLNLFLAFSAARNARARVVPNAHHRSVAAGAAFIEMRRINDISD